MSINTNIQSLIAGRVHAGHRAAMFRTLANLATGRRINRAADGPAALIASMAHRAHLVDLDAQARLAERALHQSNVADGAMQQISDLLVEARGLAVASANGAGLTDAEKQANQLQVDAILGSIDRITATTSFAGTKLLDGTATLSAVNAQVEIPSTMTSDIGATDISGTTYHLSDLAAGGALNLANGDVSGAAEVIDSAISEIAQHRGRLGAFSQQVESRLTAISVASENLAAAESAIADTDYIAEASNLVRWKLLDLTSLAALKIADTNAARVLNLLRPTEAP